jgi:hypothetical protein
MTKYARPPGDAVFVVDLILLDPRRVDLSCASGLRPLNDKPCAWAVQYYRAKEVERRLDS